MNLVGCSRLSIEAAAHDGVLSAVSTCELVPPAGCLQRDCSLRASPSMQHGFLYSQGRVAGDETVGKPTLKDEETEEVRRKDGRGRRHAAVMLRRLEPFDEGQQAATHPHRRLLHPSPSILVLNERGLGRGSASRLGKLPCRPGENRTAVRTNPNQNDTDTRQTRQTDHLASDHVGGP